MTSYQELQANNNVQQLSLAEEATCPGNTAVLTRQGPNPADPNYDTHSITFTNFNAATLGNGPCGSVINAVRFLHLSCLVNFRLVMIFFLLITHTYFVVCKVIEIFSRPDVFVHLSNLDLPVMKVDESSNYNMRAAYCK